MTATWTPRIEIFSKDERIGFVDFPDQHTDALPRVGEFVGFSKSEIGTALGLEYGPTFTPTVTSVHHRIHDSGVDVAVHIRMNTLRTAQQVHEQAKEHKIDWVPVRRILT